jgi:membrane protein YqaA with SNARE-associated domain
MEKLDYTNDALLASALGGLQNYMLDHFSIQIQVSILHKRQMTEIWVVTQPKKWACVPAAAYSTPF